jgi:hypothetical protein
MITQLAWGNKVSIAFANKAVAICRGFHWYDDAPNDFMSCMAFESDETFKPDVRNGAGSGATGLIQFMPSTAIDLGTTVQQLMRMSAEDQLDIVQQYFTPYAPRIKTLSDMYMAILLPSAIGKSEFSALFTSGTVAYRQNAALDANTDGQITKAEAAARVLAKKQRGLQPPYVLAGGWP